MPHLLTKLEAMKKEFAQLGIVEEDTYMYIQGHHIMDRVVLHILKPVCRYLRNKRETEIQRYACHRQQMSNELSSYRHSQCDVALILSKSTYYKESKQYKWLQRDIERLLHSIEAEQGKSSSGNNPK